MIEHLAIIMDGNRRWAKKRAFMPWTGHRHGIESLKNTIDFCLKEKIGILSVYVFSLENFKRSSNEQEFLFDLLIEQSEQALKEITDNGVRVRFIGNRKLFPKKVVGSIEKMESATQDAKKLTLNVLFCYSGQEEIIAAVQSIIHDVETHKLTRHDLTRETFTHYLWLQGPPPDLIIRTGKERRLSNFLLFQAAYAELYFTDTLWPDITQHDLSLAVQDYHERKRNFGA